MPSSSSRAPSTANYDSWVKGLSLLVILVAVFLLIQRLVPIEEGISALEAWLADQGAVAPILFGVIYVVATLLLLPGAALTLAGGAVFGLLVGTITVSLASTTTAACAFLIARYLARDAVARRVGDRPRFKAVDGAIEEGGWKVVALLRLSPAVPFNLQNYMYGLTAIGFWPCVLASWVAMLPGTVMYVYLGTVGRQTLEAASGGGGVGAGRWVLLIAGLVATVVVTVYVTRLASAKLEEQTHLDQVEPADEDEPEPAVFAGLSRGTLATMAVALLLGIGVGLSFVYGEQVRSAIGGWLGL